MNHILGIGGFPTYESGGRYFPNISMFGQRIYFEYLHTYPEPVQFFAKLNREIGKILQKN